MALQTWGSTISGSFGGIWSGTIAFLPNFIVALVIFVIGWIIASLIGKVVGQIIKAIKLDHALEQAGLGAIVKRAGFTLDAGAFVGGLVKWFVIVAFLVASFEVLGLNQVNVFLQSVVLLYLPQVIVAVLILLVAIVIADVLRKVVVGAARAAGVKSANFLGTITKWAIWIFALLAALVQLGIAVGFIQTLFTGVVVALSLAFGLAFGLGGQEAAARSIEKIRQEIADHQHNA
jgi:Conserved TM helix